MVATLYRSERVKHRLEAGLRQIAGITSVKGNVLTGSLLVVFARDRSADEIALLVLQQLSVDSALVATPDARSKINMHTGPRDESALVGVQGTPLGFVTPASLIYVPMRFLGSFTVSLLQMSPILIFLTLLVIMMGQIVGKKEGWSRGDALYFSFVTATTVGYGDLRPTKTSSKALSVGISFVGLVYTGIVAAIGLHSAQHAFESARSPVKF
jgi:voltage-gated potassium channel